MFNTEQSEKVINSPLFMQSTYLINVYVNRLKEPHVSFDPFLKKSATIMCI